MKPRSDLLPHLDGAPLPEGYGVDRIAGMPVGPDRLFYHWELTGGQLEVCRAQGDGRLLLRRVPLEAAPVEELGEQEGNRGQGYLPAQPGKSCVLHLVWAPAAGPERLLCESLPVRAPWQAPAEADGGRFRESRPESPEPGSQGDGTSGSRDGGSSVPAWSATIRYRE
jgi:hypothetical protein